MRTLIEDFRIYPGEHCGSSSMRGLLEHYCDLKLPEDAVFGLAAGLDCGFFESEAMDPPVGVFGRTASLEKDLGVHLEIDYREQSEEDDGHAWQVVREEVLAGRPTMLSGDILYLDYREYKVHFPGHRFVLLGFDDDIEKALIADRIRDVPEACSYGALALSRNPPEGLSTQNLWGKFHGTEVGRDLVTASRVAMRTCARRMLGKVEDGAAGEIEIPGDTGAANGVNGIRRFAASLPTWGEREDAKWVASFNARCIEKFGNGGGNFRRLYAGFLAWAQTLDVKLVPEKAPELATQAADGWTEISVLLASAARGEADEDVWNRSARIADRVANIEENLFEQLLEASA